MKGISTRIQMRSYVEKGIPKGIQRIRKAPINYWVIIALDDSIGSSSLNTENARFFNSLSTMLIKHAMEEQTSNYFPFFLLRCVWRVGLKSRI